MLQFLDDKLQVEGNYAHSLHGFMVELTIYLVSGLVTYVIISGTWQISSMLTDLLFYDLLAKTT